jgi:TRAP-type C4-dicarboxylate transport system substrate-binding protein
MLPRRRAMPGWWYRRCARNGAWQRAAGALRHGAASPAPRVGPPNVRHPIRSLIAAGFGLALALPAVGQAAPPAPIEWKLSTALGPTYPEGKAGAIWAALIGERSGGRLSATLFPGATLAQHDPAREFLALRAGAIDLAVGSAAAWATQVKELNLIALPWLVPDADALDALLQSAVAQQLAASVQAAGVVPLAWASDGFGELATRRGMHAPADLHGLTLRVAPSPLLVDTLVALGARPAAMSAADARVGERNGTLDGEVTSVAAYRTSRAYALGLTHLLVWGAHADALLFAVNRALWDGLSDADRELVRQAARDAAIQASALARSQADTAALAELAGQGATVTRLTPSGKQPFREASRAVYERWAGFVGQDLVHAAEAVVVAPR